jgi:hypothetical protein
MKRRDGYSRRISSEEARESYILVLKDRLPFFPSLGQSFDLIKDGVHGKATVESYRCTCRGPESPHEHYFIHCNGLKAKDRVEIRQDPENKSEYTIRIRR